MWKLRNIPGPTFIQAFLGNIHLVSISYLTLTADFFKSSFPTLRSLTLLSMSKSMYLRDLNYDLIKMRLYACRLPQSMPTTTFLFDWPKRYGPIYKLFLGQKPYLVVTGRSHAFTAFSWTN